MTNKLNLFSEIYGCYFTVIENILQKAENGMSNKEIEDLIQTLAFDDSSFYIIPKIFSTDWPFLENSENKIYKTQKSLLNYSRPLTNLEKSWIKTLLLDKRIQLFLSQEEIINLSKDLHDIDPIFLPDDIHYFDSAKDGDNYDESKYINNFKSILLGCRERLTLKISYVSSRQKILEKTFLPHKITYSSRDDKFRLIGVVVTSTGRYNPTTLNIARINSVEVTNKKIPKTLDLSKYTIENLHPDPIILRISTERSALERCMLQFASWEKETEFEEENDCYLCKLFYDKQDESELLIRILSFGPVIKVLGNENFLQQVKERVFRQATFNENYMFMGGK